MTANSTTFNKAANSVHMECVCVLVRNATLICKPFYYSSYNRPTERRFRRMEGRDSLLLSQMDGE